MIFEWIMNNIIDIGIVIGLIWAYFKYKDKIKEALKPFFKRKVKPKKNEKDL